MVEFLLENPLWIGLLGLMATIAAAVVWLQTGARLAAIGAGSLALLTMALVFTSLRVETPREQIRRTIYEVAEALSRNDVPKVISYIHPGALPAVVKAKGELPNYQFTEARVTRLRTIEVDQRANPPAAVAEFNVAVEIAAEGQNIPIRRLVKVYFGLSAGRWLVRDYEHFDPLANLEAGE